MKKTRTQNLQTNALSLSYREHNYEQGLYYVHKFNKREE